MVVWHSYNQDGSGFGVYGQVFDATGFRVGGEFQVNETNTLHQQYPDVAMDADGNFLVVWESQNQDGSGYGIYGRRYRADGTADTGEFLVNTTTNADQRYPTVGMAADGLSLVVWQSNSQDGSGFGIYGQRFDAAAVPVGGEFPVNLFHSGNQSQPSVGLAADHRAVTVWTSDNQDGEATGVFAALFGADGIQSAPGIW